MRPAAAELARKAQALVHPAAEAAQAAAAQYAALLRQRNWRGAAELAGSHLSRAFTWLAAAMAPAVASLRDAASRLRGAVGPVLPVQPAAKLRERAQRAKAAARSSAGAAGEWLGAKWAAVEPQLPAAIRRAPPHAMIYWLLGLGGATLAVGALLLGFSA